MVFLRRDRRPPYDRTTPWRLGLFFLGAGIWVGGLVTGRDLVKGVALGVLLIAAVLGLVSGRRSRE